MKKQFLAAIIILAVSGTAFSDITVNFPDECKLKSFDYYYAPIKQYAEATTRAERGVMTDSVSINNSKALIDIPNKNEAYLFGLNINNNNVPFYASYGDNITVTITKCDPFEYSMMGTDLIDGMNELMLLEAPIEAKALELRNQENASENDWEAINNEYNNLQKEFIISNPQREAAGIALMNLGGTDFITIYESLPDNFNNSILYPLLNKQYVREKKNVEMEKKQELMQSGDFDAPNFTLKDLEGKDVSLSDFHGKWVILDFWGSWCPWCIKGFPELKEAYEKYSEQLVIIGIDCRESESEWRAGVDKYQLPWVNVYNPEDSNLTEEYGVQGYPTKAIIDPNGKIRNITIGHNPVFFEILSKLIEEK